MKFTLHISFENLRNDVFENSNFLKYLLFKNEVFNAKEVLIVSSNCCVLSTALLFISHIFYTLCPR